MRDGDDAASSDSDDEKVTREKRRSKETNLFTKIGVPK